MLLYVWRCDLLFANNTCNQADSDACDSQPARSDRRRVAPKEAAFIGTEQQPRQLR